MKLTISSVQDFAEVSLAHARLVRDTSAGPTRLEVVLAPGSYDGSSLILRERSGPNRVDLWIHGQEGAPVVFNGAKLDLSAPVVQVDHLLFTGHQTSGIPLRVRVGERVEIRQVSFVDKSFPAPGGGSRSLSAALWLGAVGGAVQAEVADCLFLGNQGASPLLRVESRKGGAFEALRFSGCRFAANAGSPLLEVRGAANLLAEGGGFWPLDQGAVFASLPVEGLQVHPQPLPQEQVDAWRQEAMSAE